MVAESKMASLNIQAVLDYGKKHGHVGRSLDLIRQAMESYKFDQSKFAIAFNGGKDCTVLLHLVHAALVSYRPGSKRAEPLRTVYIKDKDIFPEVQEFVKESVQRYDLELLTFDGPCYKKALTALKESSVGHSVDAIFMGTRASDVSYPLASQQRTDSSWPSFLRINPLINWNYQEIWSFLLDLKVPYCSLYDHGYTSLGDRSSTMPNPRLQRQLSNGQISYLPAYKLDDQTAERSGRSK